MPRQKSEVLALAEAYRNSPLAGRAFRVAGGERDVDFPNLVAEDDRLWKIRVLIHDNVNRVRNPLIKEALQHVLFSPVEDLAAFMERH